MHGTVSILISIVAESVIKSTETMGRMSGATVNSSPVNPSTTVPRRGNGSVIDYTPCLLARCKSYYDISVTSKSSFPHNSFKSHTITENAGCIAKMISEKAACVFLALCALTVTSLWFTERGQIVLLWVWSTKCCLLVAQQRNTFGALLRICASRLKETFIGKAMFILL